MLRARVGKSERALETIRNAPEANERKIKSFELQVSLDAKATVYLETLVKEHGSNRLCVIGKNGKLPGRVYDKDGLTFNGISTTDQFQAIVNAKTT